MAVVEVLIHCPLHPPLNHQNHSTTMPSHLNKWCLQRVSRLAQNLGFIYSFLSFTLVLTSRLPGLISILYPEMGHVSAFPCDSRCARAPPLISIHHCNCHLSLPLPRPLGLMSEGLVLRGASSPKPSGFLASCRKEFKASGRQKVKV